MPAYLENGKDIYKWTKSKLQDPSDYLYWDCIKTSGKIETSKFSYNSGQMLQAAVLLYNATGEEQYLTDAKLLAEACYNYFFENFIPIRRESNSAFSKTEVAGSMRSWSADSSN